jgi:peptidoglycan/xylan/chitin deacetylase (PgdA/CDA1 family)
MASRAHTARRSGQTFELGPVVEVSAVSSIGLPREPGQTRVPETHDRDLRGSEGSPVHAKWPGGARVAVSFVINYEEGAEYSFPAGDGISETYLAEVAWGALPPGFRMLGAESLYDYGARAGIWRLQELFASRSMVGTVYAAGQAVELNPAPMKVLHESGWEIGSHHYRFINYWGMSESEERSHLQKAIRAIHDAVGVRPVGLYGGRVSANTRRLAAEEGGFTWESDAYDDDLPYWRTVGGKPYLLIPYQLDCNDFRYAMTPGWTSGEDFLSYLKNSFDLLYDEGLRRPKMMSIGLHPRVSGRPGRASILARFLDYVASHDGAWVCTRREIAAHWREHHPPPS